MGHNSGDNQSRGSGSSSFDVWNNFFLSAGIPNNVAHSYAVTFSQHRIRIDMLKEITKDILLDMNIKAMGDIIAILRHAKNLCAQDELRVGAKAAAVNSTTTPIPHPTSPNYIKTSSTSTRNEPHLSHRTPNNTSSSNQRASASLSNFASGNKIQSRLNLSSGALLASSAQSNDYSDRNNNSNNYSNTSNGHHKDKRPTSSSSSVSSSLAKRLGPARDDRRILKRNLPEKTLTVHYPSKLAIAKARERISGKSSTVDVARNSSSGGSSSSKPVSIKSRLGATVVRSHRN